MLSAAEPVAQTTIAPASTANETKTWLTLLGACAGLGTVLTSAVNMFRWFSERSAARRKLENMTYALKLEEFIAAESRLSAATRNARELQNATAVARCELQSSLRKLDNTVQPISTLRRMALLYPPKHRLAWIPHTMFYAFCIFIPLFAVSAFTDDDSGFNFADKCAVLILVMIIASVFQRWGALEYRIAETVHLGPIDMRAVRWYPSNNRHGLLSNVMIGMGAFSVITTVGFLFGIGSSAALPFDPISRWEHAVSFLLCSSFIPLGWYWSQAEFMYLGRVKRTPHLRDFARLVREAQAAEQYVGIGMLGLLAIWNLVLLWRLRTVPLSASLPDSDGTGRIGWVVPSIQNAGYILLVGLWPLMAVYRGLWSLNDYAATAPSTELCTKSEVKNG
jgi:hypothetical protein